MLYRVTNANIHYEKTLLFNALRPYGFISSYSPIIYS